MYNIIKKYCEGKNNNGLLLLDMPTGCGKTHSVVEYIADVIRNPSDTRKIFFITTQKKNLPENKLKSFFKTKKDQEIYKKKFLCVDSNLESVIDGLSQTEVKDTIPYSIKETDEYKHLENDILNISRLRNKQEHDSKILLSRVEDTARQETEPKFRKLLEYRLEKEYPDKKDRIRAIQENKNWKWVKELYPSTTIKNKKVIFMSVDKFLLPISLIAEPSITLYNSNLIDNAIVFIDEIDATKETVLKNIITNCKNKRIDQIEFFKTVYYALHYHSFPQKLTKPSSQWKKGKIESPYEIIEKLKIISQEIYNNYSLCYNYKTESTTDKSANNFLFQDALCYSILNGNKSFITWKHDHDDLTNIIRFSEKLSDNNDIKNLLYELNGFTSYFMRAVGILARNYHQSCIEENKENELTLEEAIGTILSEFNLGSETKNWLINEILSDTYKSKIQLNMADIMDLSFYEKGFRYYAFEDAYSHDTLSKIMSAAFTLSPEKILLQICKKAKVLGISATALNPSVIGNYDQSYLKAKLGDKYITIKSDERDRLKNVFENSVKGYNKVDIDVYLTGWGKFSLAACEDVIGKMYADELYNMINQGVPYSESNDKVEYFKLRYLRIAYAFNFFITHSDIQSFLCVLTKHPRTNDRELDFAVLHNIFDYLVKIARQSFNVKRNVVQLDKENYDSKKDDIARRLYEGERLFVISVYQTIGVGQNLQYRIPECYKHQIITINDRPGDAEKDFDAIYLDKPTNLITNFINLCTYEDFLKYIYQIEMLQENGEISINDSETLIKKTHSDVFMQ